MLLNSLDYRIANIFQKIVAFSEPLELNLSKNLCLGFNSFKYIETLALIINNYGKQRHRLCLP